MSEACPDRLEARLDRFDERLRHIDETVIRIDERLATVLPHLATKAELADLKAEMAAQLADKPSRLYMWGVMAAMMTGAYTAALAAIGVLLSYLPHRGRPTRARSGNRGLQALSSGVRAAGALAQFSSGWPMASPKRRAASKVSPYLRWPAEIWALASNSRARSAHWFLP
jgi:hypothetical protein